MSNGISVTNLVKAYGKSPDAAPAVKGITFEVDEGQFFTLLGPSGCGKTTTLRCIAGLEQPTAGEITLANRRLFSSRAKIDTPANQRGLGMMFQSYAIWPHMTVFENVAFPLRVLPRRSRLSGRQVRERVDRALAVVELGHLASRRATDLSGGQQQRLALARAIVLEPPVLLLDEPLSNLDAKLRQVMRVEIKRLQTELGITTIYVTHDQAEALAMSDQVAVMEQGEISQLGTPRDIYRKPATQFVAEFVGETNLFEGEVVDAGAGEKALVELRPGSVEAIAGAGVTIQSGEALVSIRPENIVMLPANGSSHPADVGRWTGTVENAVFLGNTVDYVVDCGGSPVNVTASDAELAIGDEVILVVRENGASVIR